MSDFLVVGAGAVGMLTALALRQRGYAVTLLERHLAGRESSWAGGGILSPLYPWRYSDAVNALAQRSQQLYPALVESLQADTGMNPELLPSGLLMLDDVAGQDATSTLPPQDWAQQRGVVLQSLPASEIAYVQAGVVHEKRAAWWMPEVMQIRNPRLLHALRAALDVHGVKLLEHTEVRRLDVTGGRVNGLCLRDRDLSAEGVVVAAGAWSATLLQAMGIDMTLRTKIEPVRGQMLLLNAPGSGLHRIVMSDGRYLIPRKDGRVVVGSTLEYAGFNKMTTDEARESLHAFATRLCPELEGVPIEAHWAGLRPGSPQGIPYIGQHPEIQGLFIHAGHFRNGLVMGPASTELLMQIIGKQVTMLSPEPYAWRFRDSFASAGC